MIKKIISTLWNDVSDDVHTLVFVCNLMSCIIFAGVDYFFTGRKPIEEVLFVVIAMVMFFLIYSVCLLIRYVFVTLFKDILELHEYDND